MKNGSSEFVDLARFFASRTLLEDTKSLASRPSHTSSDGSTGVTGRRSCYAHAVNTCPTRAAGSSDLRDYAVWLCYWRGCHGVR
jgi:hypothetical protein